MSNYFEELYAVPVTEHIEKKNGFSYVSWPFAVAELRKRHPEAVWEVKRFDGLPFMVSTCGVFVEVAVTVNGVTLSQLLPVLDHMHRTVMEPNAFQINTSIQRCLVKAIALHGLGLHVYAGEDLPEGADAPKGATTPPRPPVAPRKATPAPKAAPDGKTATPDQRARFLKLLTDGKKTATRDQRARFLKLLKPVSDEACVFFGVDSLDQIADMDFPSTEREADEIMDGIRKLVDEGERPKESGWRSFPLPFGKHKGWTLGQAADQDRKYLLALAHKYTVDTLDKEGKPRKQSWIDGDQLLRDALDAYLDHERTEPAR